MVRKGSLAFEIDGPADGSIAADEEYVGDIFVI